MLTTGLISSTGNIAAANIAAGNITSAIISATGNITGPNITATLLSISATASITGNIQGGNFLTTGLISTTGNITSNYFIGNGGLLTGISVTKIGNGTSEVNIPSASGNANITVDGASNVAVFATTGAYVTGVINANGNITGGNLTTAGRISSTGNIVTNANLVTINTVINSSVSTGGNVIGANINTTGLISASGNVRGGNIIAAANVTTANLTVSGISNLNANANVKITGGANAQALITDGTGNLSWANVANIAGAPATQIVTTWVPTLIATGGGSFTYSVQSGYYIKSGQSVTAYFTVTITGTTGVSGTVRLGDLPVTSINQTNAGGGALDNYSFAALPSHVTGLVAANSTYMALYWHDRSGSTNTMGLMTTGNLGTSATLIGRITYISAT